MHLHLMSYTKQMLENSTFKQYHMRGTACCLVCNQNHSRADIEYDGTSSSVMLLLYNSSTSLLVSSNMATDYDLFIYLIIYLPQ